MSPAGFPPEICLGYGIFKNLQIPHEIKEKALFLSLLLMVLIPYPSTLWRKPCPDETYSVKTE
jgi:hypothetical protein